MIYLDMDGVLADFDGALLQRGITNENQFIHKPREEWTPAEQELDKVVVACMSEPDWFYNLPVLEGASDLVAQACIYGQPTVLTARPKIDKMNTAVQKSKWLAQNFPGLFTNNFICCLRHEKQKYAKEAGDGPCQEFGIYDKPNILVDDLESNCREWEAAGGKAVLYKNAKQAIEDLKNIVNS
jgi:5'(3')-deoxyribonucleotidase